MKLQAVLTIIVPIPARLNEFSGGDHSRMADDGDEIPLAAPFARSTAKPFYSSGKLPAQRDLPRQLLDPRDISAHGAVEEHRFRRYLRSDTVEPKFNIPDRPSRLDLYADKLSQMLRQEAGKSRKQKRTTKQLRADLAALGYDGSYNRVAAFARDWKAARQQEQQTCGRGVFVPLAFLPGEAFQFDWSEDWAVIGGERTKLQVAHFKLSYSRAFILRAYPQQTHKMLFDAHDHAFRVLGGVPRRGRLRQYANCRRQDRSRKRAPSVVLPHILCAMTIAEAWKFVRGQYPSQYPGDRGPAIAGHDLRLASAR